MKYAEERGGMATSVHDWKPCPPDRFAKLMHQYTTQYGDEWGHGALTMTAMKLDRISTCTIFYYPQNGDIGKNVRSPVLMTVSMIDGKVITFESLKYGVNAPEDGFRDEDGNKVNADGVKIIETGLNIRSGGSTVLKMTGGDATFTGTVTADKLATAASVQAGVSNIASKTTGHATTGYSDARSTLTVPTIPERDHVSISQPRITSFFLASESSKFDNVGSGKLKLHMVWEYICEPSTANGFEININGVLHFVSKDERSFKLPDIYSAPEIKVSIRAYQMLSNGQVFHGAADSTTKKF
jgi:hypothetical protein